jgi:hypothetical protein
LNIKKDGAFTGETLYYSIQPYYQGSGLSQDKTGNPQGKSFRWELKTKRTTRSVLFNADRTTMQPLGQARLDTDDALGDPTATAFSGPQPTFSNLCS